MNRAQRPWRCKRVAATPEDITHGTDTMPHFLEQRGLADAGLAGNQRNGAMPIIGCVSEVIEFSKQVVSF